MKSTMRRRYILGRRLGMKPRYQFHDEDAQPPFERRAGFGFRCMLQRQRARAPTC